jgi:putative transcriptional regulator
MEGSISNQIRILRFHHGEMSQAELGQRIGVTRQTIAAIEAGKYSPSLEAAFRIAHVFGVPLGEVFQWNTSGTPLKEIPNFRLP